MGDDQNQQKLCVVCSMPLQTEDDYPEGADLKTVKHCKHCGTKDGLYAYKDLVKGMAGFMAKTQGMSEDQAKIAAKQIIDNCQAVKMGMLEVDED